MILLFNRRASFFVFVWMWVQKGDDLQIKMKDFEEQHFEEERWWLTNKVKNSLLLESLELVINLWVFESSLVVVSHYSSLLH